ncbi:hypothetical protein JCM33374_g4257 [Metschnikowia sp. JCM 33374]|nr:hypothetical protein JCM33374_g4257 [Metschnikowia sp. JCM 33374]
MFDDKLDKMQNNPMKVDDLSFKSTGALKIDQSPTLKTPAKKQNRRRKGQKPELLPGQTTITTFIQSKRIGTLQSPLFVPSDDENEEKDDVYQFMKDSLGFGPELRGPIAESEERHLSSQESSPEKRHQVPKNQLRPAIVTRNHDTYKDSSYSSDSDQEIEYKITGKAKILVDILGCFDRLIDETPPLKGPRRFGNMACRDWHAKVNSQSLDLLKQLSTDEKYLKELNHYLVNAFGSELRLDYGSGHELSFIAFIGGLFEYGALGKDVPGQDILTIFSRYYDLTRRLILDYSLEPAGSHGVWGLDDHFHFIYILGAAQFNTRPGKSASFQYVPPVSQVLSSHVISTYKTSNLYVNAIAFIFKLKSGPFHEHSPVLYDIHKSVSLWGKVQSGLLKMYEVEVFGKFPVVQHFWFGEGLYPWKDAISLRPLPVKPADEPETTSGEVDENLPGLINGLQGTKTTNSNISMTGAPWARNSTTRSLPARSARGIGRTTASNTKVYSNAKDSI